MMRIILLSVLSILCLSSYAQNYVNPEGVYALKSKTKKDKNGDVWGRTGQIQVKLIDRHKAVVVISGCRNAPSYNSGSLQDTVEYINNRVVCLTEFDTTCVIQIEFTSKAAVVMQKGNYCGFGNAVSVDGTYKKRKKGITDLIHPQTGELIEQ